MLARRCRLKVTSREQRTVIWAAYWPSRKTLTLTRTIKRARLTRGPPSESKSTITVMGMSTRLWTHLTMTWMANGYGRNPWSHRYSTTTVNSLLTCMITSRRLILVSNSSIKCMVTQIYRNCRGNKRNYMDATWPLNKSSNTKATPKNAPTNSSTPLSK